ncbi:sugar-binding protein [Nonomuraea sp. NPDC050536]|uniref:sugar-binding protein n=1 Tax=Nonomuraea sp. NPDC050536 TaxID=3364366 RepID=UPI0037C88304
MRALLVAALLHLFPITPTTVSPTPPQADLDVLFVGAHPDDEAFSLSTLGQWNEDHRLRAGVVTVTRGEGGGNAVGPEEGPALGLLREGEERAAVGKAGVRDVFNLDDVDFYYTVSAPLTDQIWGGDTLEKVVRVVRQTRPEVMLTMDPAPTPGNHGNHQQAARLAIEAYYAAADPKAFPEQITREGLKPFAPARLFLGGARGIAPRTGPECESVSDPVRDVYAVWSGRQSQSQGRSWAAIERDAQRTYASQGWAGFPDVPSDPAKLGCDYFTQVDSRVPIPEPGTASPTAMLEGAVVQGQGGLPLGTQLSLNTGSFAVRPGQPFTVTVSLKSRGSLGRVSVEPRVPDGWKVSGSGTTFTVTPGATFGRARIGAVVTTDRGRGYADRQVEVGPAVRGQQQLLPQVTQYEKWAAVAPQLRGIVTPVLTLPSGGSRQVGVTVTNVGSATESGTVRLALPSGFTADRTEAAYSGLAAGATTTVPFTITNSDPSLKTSNEGGDYAYTITTTGSDGSSVAKPALELVPSATIPQATTAPAVDGVESPGEYPGQALDISRVWEGSPCASPADCSGTAKVTWRDGTLFVLVNVKDDVLGTKLATSDCKRHWRTDSVEVTFDPRGTSENTSTTFKTAVLPVTAEGPPCVLRDADNHQGPGAPGEKVASKVSAGEYTVELSIPIAALPGPVDPAHLGMNILVYDSDTQDKTGQTRIGWSTWGGVQGDPYRWGVATLAGYQPGTGTVPDPVIPNTALSSLDSPQSLEQAARLGLPLAGGPAAPRSEAGWVTAAKVSGQAVQVRFHADSPGELHLFVRDDQGTAGGKVATVSRDGTVTVPLTRALSGNASVVAGWNSAGTLASQVRVR